MKNEVGRLIDALREGAIIEEGLAQHLADLADRYGRNGDHPRAEGMRNLSRYHRIRSMQANAQIASFIFKFKYNPKKIV